MLTLTPLHGHESPRWSLGLKIEPRECFFPQFDALVFQRKSSGGAAVMAVPTNDEVKELGLETSLAATCACAGMGSGLKGALGRGSGLPELCGRRAAPEGPCFLSGEGLHGGD